MRTVSAADANRQFSRMLREVARGETITVVSRGRPVAAICPLQDERPERWQARADLLKRLRRQGATGTRDWTRDELYNH
ncbi:MAG: type II toxin-antitoxin system prevent-host-death family antitoxin [Desulfuromonadales bacterium]|nr:type II toxin-antitoxin system prevent-host-death family antitoxin [Desulfuromonadales bacterium]